MERYRRIQVLLRLAELCSPDEESRKRQYMDQIDVLLLDDINDKSDELLDDSISKFIEEKAEKRGYIRRSKLYSEYFDFCVSNQLCALRKSDFFIDMRSRGFTEKKMHDGNNYFVGIQLGGKHE